MSKNTWTSNRQWPVPRSQYSFVASMPLSALVEKTTTVQYVPMSGENAFDNRMWNCVVVVASCLKGSENKAALFICCQFAEFFWIQIGTGKSGREVKKLVSVVWSKSENVDSGVESLWMGSSHHNTGQVNSTGQVKKSSMWSCLKT